MSRKLDDLFGDLRRDLNADHEERRETLVAQLGNTSISGRISSSSWRISLLKCVAVVLVFLGLTGTILLLPRARSASLWAANNDFSVDASVTKRQDGSIVSRYEIREFRNDDGKRKEVKIAGPTLAVREGQSASILVANGMREINVEQVFATDAKQLLVVVTIKDSSGKIQWATAFTKKVQEEEVEQ